MKIIALNELDEHLAEALRLEDREDPIVLTSGSNAIGLLLRLPEGTKDSDLDDTVLHDVVFRIGARIVALQLKEAEGDQPCVPKFGSCQEMMTIVSEDEEHLEDFKEYMP